MRTQASIYQVAQLYFCGINKERTMHKITSQPEAGKTYFPYYMWSSI
jgi:hypothetical protein